MTVASVRESAKVVKAAIRRCGDLVSSYALPTALTWAARDARDELYRNLPNTFDRPTPYTMRSLRYRPASKNSPVAWVGFRDDAGGKGTAAEKYLLPNVTGGGRRDKRMERQLRAAGFLAPGMFAVPGEEAKIDSYGNMSRSQVTKILSQIGAFGEQGYSANRTGSSRSRAKRRVEGYFVAVRGNASNLPPGVYRRDNADPRPVLLFVKPPAYRPRFHFYKIVEQAVRARFPIRFAEAMAVVGKKIAVGGRS